MYYRPKHIIEYGALRSTAAILCILPYRAALTFGWCLTRLAFHLFRFRRKEALRRIHEVFGPDLPKKRARQIAWISLRNIAFNAIEMMRTHLISKEWVLQRIPNVEETCKPILDH